MGTYYTQLGISSAMIGAAIAASIIHDINVNDLNAQGFPGIDVARGDTGFDISLNYRGHSVSFGLSEAEAKAAVKQVKSTGTHHKPIFDRVQEALASLESLARA
ncbi:hypothetical protein [Brevundimonas nasdae]|uniref:hypothetical protein n=1 Tax=Brevundimonas nasdae TaxID=172043 RepID=UPI003F68C833